MVKDLYRLDFDESELFWKIYCVGEKDLGYLWDWNVFCDDINIFD